MSLHDAQELDNDLGRRSNHDLALAGLLGIVDGVERIVEDGVFGHDEETAGKILRAIYGLRYLWASLVSS